MFDALHADPLIGPLIRANPGRRVPGHVDPDEIAFRAVLGQQVSLAGAATLAGRLVADYGEPLRAPLGSVTHLFPRAGTLAGADPERLPMPASRGRALIGLAKALDEGRVVLGGATDHAEARERLLELPGIGPWTAEYVALGRFATPTRSCRPTSACAGRSSDWASTAARQMPQGSPKTGVHTAPTRSCIYGRRSYIRSSPRGNP